MFHTLEDILSPLEEKYQADVLVEINNFGTDADHIIATSDNDSVCIDSFRRLKNGCYLNDEIINYICMLEKNYDHKCYIRRKRNKLSYTFSSFFMTKLLDEKKNTATTMFLNGVMVVIMVIYLVLNIYILL